jgi:hypothetical protein
MHIEIEHTSRIDFLDFPYAISIEQIFFANFQKPDYLLSFHFEVQALVSPGKLVMIVFSFWAFALNFPKVSIMAPMGFARAP